MHLNRRTLHDPSPLSLDAIHVAVYAALPVSVEPEVCANSPTMAYPSVLRVTGFPAVFPMTIAARLLSSALVPAAYSNPSSTSRDSNF
jgi:hypothetical protein